MDQANFQVLYDRTARRLWAYLFHSCGNAATADDLLQDTFFRFLGAQRPSMDDRHTRSYLFRIATNLLHDRGRHDRRRGIAEQPSQDLPDIPCEDNVDAQIDVRAALRKLKVRERQLLWLAHVEGFDHREIAASMGLGRASVKILLFRARAKFAEALGITDAVARLRRQ